MQKAVPLHLIVACNHTVRSTWQVTRKAASAIHADDDAAESCDGVACARRARHDARYHRQVHNHVSCKCAHRHGCAYGPCDTVLHKLSPFGLTNADGRKGAQAFQYDDVFACALDDRLPCI